MISFWEVAMLKDKGRIRFSLRMSASGVGSNWNRAWSKSLSMERSESEAVSLPDFHADPADRLIVATALEGHRLVTPPTRVSWVAGLAEPAPSYGMRGFSSLGFTHV